MGIFKQVKDVRATAADGPDFEPIATVSLRLYAEIAKDLASVNYDQTQAPRLAAARGVAAGDWNSAVEGWNARIARNTEVSRRFNAYYGQA